MALPLPNLDDRRFQDLVDDAKRLVQQRCPAWTDHNVHDPGVTLIETFAFMTDALLYRLNRIPDRHFVAFLDLIGVRLFPPTAARVPVTFWLSAPRETTIEVPEGTTVTTLRTEDEEAVVFTTVAPLSIPPVGLQATATQIFEGEVIDTTGTLAFEQGFACFSSPPRVGDMLLVGLSEPAPHCAVALRLDARIEGIGVDPLDPPLAWEAFTGTDWEPCEVDHDDTGGLNAAGVVVLHIPGGHAASVVGGARAGWLRARVVEAAEGQPFYSSSPRIVSAGATTVGGTVEATNADRVLGEVVGLSEGVPGQHFPLQRTPVIASGEPLELEVAGGSGWVIWTQVDNFADSGPEDTHFTLDRVNGELAFGPAVREPDGTLHHYGAVPPKGAPLRLRQYRVGGGRHGNVARRTITVLKNTIPFVARVENRRPAAGGVDAETLDAAKVRGPILLRTRNRAVTAEDYEQLAREAAPDVSRVRCLPATEEAEAGVVRILVVPAVAAGADGALGFEQLVPTDDALARIAAYLDERRCLGARVVVEPPRYQGVTVVARLRPTQLANPARLRAAALAALYRYFSPIEGGPEGTGWPFGGPIQAGEIYAVLQQLPGCDVVEEARLFGTDPITGRRGSESRRLDLDAQSLAFSYGHQVRVG